MPDFAEFKFRDATQAEIGRIKGEALRLAGNQEASHETLIAPYIRGERDPALLASLGLEECANGHDAIARKFLDAAASAKVIRPRAYLELARIRFREAAEQPSAGGGKLSAGQVEGILRPLFVAREQRPILPEVYETIADTWRYSVTPPKREDLQVVIEGVHYFPGRAALIYKAAQLAAQDGFISEAKVFTELGLKISGEDKSKQRFAELKASLPISVTPQPLDRERNIPDSPR